MFIDTLFSACFPYNAIHIPWKISDGEVGDSSADWPIMRLLQRDHWSIYPTEQHDMQMTRLSLEQVPVSVFYQLQIRTLG